MLGQMVGSYRVERLIGEGGMGRVYSAVHPLIGRKAAVKVLLRSLSRDTGIVERFFNEARAAARLRHPGVVDVFDSGYAPDGSAFLVMELLPGESLAARLDREAARAATMEVSLAVELARQVAVALGAAHGQGIVHRDLKPDNIFLVPDAELGCGLRAKVLDFGIAKLAGNWSGQKPTQAGMIMGTPGYMSPEQCTDTSLVDHRTDVYALGCVLFEMVCGRLPFLDSNPGPLMTAHMHTPPPSPREFNPGLPREVEALILRALSKDPAARQQSMQALSAELKGLLEHLRAPRLPSLPPIDDDPDPAAEPADPTIPAAAQTTGSGANSELALTLVHSSDRAAVHDAERRGHGRKKALWAAGIIVCAALAISRLSPRTPTIPATATAATTATIAGAPPAAALAPIVTPLAPSSERLKIRLTIRSEPAGAQVVRLGDERSGQAKVIIGETPVEDRVDAITNGETHYLLRLPRYREARVMLPSDRDGEVSVMLERSAVAAPAQRRKPSDVAAPGAPPPAGVIGRDDVIE